jgi:hypothetical protein
VAGTLTILHYPLISTMEPLFPLHLENIPGVVNDNFSGGGISLAIGLPFISVLCICQQESMPSDAISLRLENIELVSKINIHQQQPYHVLKHQ